MDAGVDSGRGDLCGDGAELVVQRVNALGQDFGASNRSGSNKERKDQGEENETTKRHDAAVSQGGGENPSGEQEEARATGKESAEDGEVSHGVGLVVACDQGCEPHERRV